MREIESFPNSWRPWILDLWGKAGGGESLYDWSPALWPGIAPKWSDRHFHLRVCTEKAGLEHDLPVGAEQARNRLKTSRYDVVVSDFSMPGESGLDLFRYVSSIYRDLHLS